METEAIVSELRKIQSIGPTGDSKGDWHRVMTRIGLLVKALEHGRQGMESVRESSSKVFHLD
jgi:hypothetical protein